LNSDFFKNNTTFKGKILKNDFISLLEEYSKKYYAFFHEKSIINSKIGC